jgi:hypothetical protein
MAIGSGLSAQFGLKAETVYGTPVTVDRFLEFLNESLVDDVEPVDVFSLGMGRVQRSSHIVHVVTGASGSVELIVLNKGFGTIFQQCFGVAASVQVGATLEYTQTFSIDLAGGQYGVNATYQVGVPDVTGTVRTKTLEGGKVTAFHLNAALSDALKLTVDLVGEQMLNTTALAAASYATGRAPFVYSQGCLTVAGVENVVKSITIDVDHGLDDDRHGLCAALRREPIAAGEAVISGTFDAEFASLANWDAFKAGTLSQLILDFTGPVIPGTSNPYKLTLTLPKCRFTGETPQVGGPEIVRQAVAFQSVYDGTANPLTMVVHTDDIAL